jgi:GNAT superfamily N-acetyltransferase
MDVKVRRATAADAPVLARLRWRWRTEELGEAGLERDDFAEFFAAWVIDHLVSHVPFVVEVDGRLAGMAFLAMTERVPSPSYMDRRTGDVQSVYVVPELRDRGVGACLLEAVFQHAKDRELTFLTVHAAARAVRFYRRWGFESEDRWMEWRPS